MKSYLKLKELFKQLSQLHYTQRIMQWDEAVMMPEGAAETRAQAMATLSGLTQKMLVNKKNQTLIAAAKQEQGLSAWDSANLAWMEHKYTVAACIPVKLTEKLTTASMNCEQAWRKMRAQNNWKQFLPHFNKVFKLVKETTKRRADVLQLSPYDALLDQYAPGFNQKKIDAIFADLKQTMPALVQQAKNKQSKEQVALPAGPFAMELQKELGLTVMHALQFDFNQGRLDVSHHPFCSGGPTDVRMTTRYQKDDFHSALLGICHETGHALYEQGLPREWIDQPVGVVDSMAMHESQSLLIEMQLCRSPEFYHYLLPEVKNKFGEQEAFTADNLYQLAIRVKPNLIRVEADEVTYPLHIILRYELEKALFNDEITLKDLPTRWDELMRSYLGLSTKGNDKDGVMQDVHWPSGAFGYFPAYTLGRLMAAQFFATFLRQNPQFFAEAAKGNFSGLVNWLHKNIHSQASVLPTEDLLKKVTGESLNSKYFLDHIKQRYL